MNRERPFGRFFASLASMRVTVVLLALSCLLVFLGTLAQVDKGLWTAVDQYFRCFFAKLQLGDFSLPFPGGWLLGGALLVNLLAAHVVRFKVVARGPSLWAGLAVVAVGIGCAGYVVSRALDDDSASAAVSPTWRVTRQLLEGGGAAVVLLAGCGLMFRRRAGSVLLHAGIILMMVNELWAGLYAVEGHMSIGEGQTVNYVEDLRHMELAIVDPSDAEVDTVVVVPDSLLQKGSRVRHALLPFEVEVVSFTPNSDVRREAPSASLTFHDPRGGKSLGAHSILLGELQAVSFEGKTYEVALRRRRTYKPYSIELIDVRFDKYAGTSMARNYSSDVRLIDPARGVDRRAKIWMNNPLRYRGETLYQSGVTQDEKGTTLQVVRNAAWMIPYIGCMIVATGMLAQFSVVLVDFLRRRKAGA